MDKFNAELASVHTVGAPVEAKAPRGHGAYVGLDVHKETIAIAVAEPGRGAPFYGGEIAHQPTSIARLVDRLSARYGGGRLQFVYEAGSCGYGLYRQRMASGHEVQVVAPSHAPATGMRGAC